jgi:hypothetical protein
MTVTSAHHMTVTSAQHTGQVIDEALMRRGACEHPPGLRVEARPQA